MLRVQMRKMMVVPMAVEVQLESALRATGAHRAADPDQPAALAPGVVAQVLATWETRVATRAATQEAGQAVAMLLTSVSLRKVAPWLSGRYPSHTSVSG